MYEVFGKYDILAGRLALEISEEEYSNFQRMLTLGKCHTGALICVL